MHNQCTNCPLNIYPQIPPTEPFKADVAIVGMNPGVREISAKKPFVGPSGELLRKTLSKAGLPSNPYITNALLCMPPEDININRTHIQNCRERVLNELAIVKPKIILAFGNIALHSLTNNYKLKIGTCHSTPIKFNNSLIIPIYHPAAVLRNIGNYKTFLNGFYYARSLLTSPTHKKDPGVTSYVVADMSHITHILELLKSFPVISCDIETTGLNEKVAKILALGISYVKNKVIVFPPDMLPYIQQILNHCKASYQRGQYDTAVLSEHGIETEVAHDTLLQHYCLDENTGNHDLKTLAKRFLGAQDYDKGIDKSKMAELPLEELYKYLAKDADYTLQLHNLFSPMIEKDTNLCSVYYKILIPGINYLRRTTQRGTYIDQEYLHKLKVEVGEELNILRQQTIDTFGILWDREQYLKDTTAKSASVILNINSSDQKRWLLFTRMQLVPRIRKKTKSGKPSVKSEVLESINPKPLALELLLKYSKLHKLFTTYIVGIEKKVGSDSRLHSSFSLQTTVTGRLSSSKPNIQNIPRDKKIKGIFVAPKDRILITADFKGVELRVLAHLSKDPYLIEIFKQGRDLHDEMSIEMFGKNFTYEQRVAVKGVNFGAIYGRTAYSIAEEFNIPLWRAQQLIDKLFEMAPVAKEYLDGLEEQLRAGIPLLTPFGRYRRFGIVTGDQHQLNEAKNFPVQSTASDLTLLSGIALERPLLAIGNAFSDNIVHDELKIEANNIKLEVIEIIDLVNDTMMGIPKKWLNPEIDFPVEISVGHRWGYLKSIDIKTKQLV